MIAEVEDVTYRKLFMRVKGKSRIGRCDTFGRERKNCAGAEISLPAPALMKVCRLINLFSDPPWP